MPPATVPEAPREVADHLRRRLARATRQQDALLRLAAAAELELEPRLRTILRVGAEVLEVARVSFWRLAEGGQAIRCEALWRTDTQAYEAGLVLQETDYPRYFAALHSGAVIVASDAHTDPQTSEFAPGYLGPLGIGAMMDVPVYVRGKLVGVICHEHVGAARTFSTDEQLFATSTCQLLSLALESAVRRRAEEALRESEARFRAIAMVSPVPLIVNALPGGECLWANDAACALSGVPADEVVGKLAPDFYARPGDRAIVLGRFQAQGHVEGHEVELLRVDGTTYWAMISIRPLTLDGRAAAICSITDLTEQKRLEEILRRAALHDALTGLPNRELFFELLRRELGRAERDASYRFAVLYLDLDGFKAVNDTLGHDVGDRLLVSVAARIREGLRPMDAVARMGGDEFAVLLPAVGSPVEVDGIVARLDAALAQPHAIGAHTCRAPASIGLVLGDAGPPGGPDALLRAADLAMYERKRARGGGR